MTHFDDSCKVGQIEHLLLAGGSDQRAYQVLRICKKNNVNVKQVVLFNFHERVNSLGAEDPYFDYKTIDFPLQLVDCTITEPISCMDGLQVALKKVESPDNVAIDISCFTKPYFFYVLKFLHERLSIRNPLAFYTEPNSYRFPKKGLFTSYHEGIGPVRIVEMPGFNGTRPRGALTVLVVQLGFEAISLDEIILDVSPNETLLVNGFPSYAPKFKDISLTINEAYTVNKDNFILYSSANNPFEVFNLLEKVKRNFKNVFLNIAPLGTKPMALGACMFAISNPDVKVVFPYSEKYETVTTEESWSSWMYRVPLTI